MAATKTGTVVYDLEGSLLEACSCGVLCPCWVGEDPDRGVCMACIAYHYDRGTIRGIDVSGLTFAGAAYIPGNVLQGNWKLALFVDDRASDEQMEAIIDAHGGKLGGPLGDLSQLFGEIVSVQRAPIKHEITEGQGKLMVGDAIQAEMEPYRSAEGDVTTLHDTVFSTVPGSPAWVGKAGFLRVTLPEFDMEWSFENSNAIQASWKITHTE
jgi:hypothetical protein